MPIFFQSVLFQSILVASAIVAIAIPAVFVGVRQSTKLLRQGMVADLSSVFERNAEYGPVVIPSFEFVKYKYQVASGRTYGDFKAHHWLLGAVPLSLFLFVMNAFSLSVVLHAAFRQPVAIGVPWLAGDRAMPLVAWVLLAAYTGGILFTLRAFKQAVNNFDMSPLSLVGAIVNLVFGLASAVLLAFALFKLPYLVAAPATADRALFPLVIVTAFAAGYYPDVAVRQLMKLSRLRNYKREPDDLYAKFKAIPIDVIDGIDGEIRSRLDDYHLNSVQNLATANPLMLFVETPYGVYQIMDWVAQAQLCSSVGPRALLQLWDLGIRTIFDLERVALDPCCTDAVLIAQIGDILWASQEHALARRRAQAPSVAGAAPAASPAAAEAHPTLSAVKADIRVRLENPHSLRLRQIFNQVSLSLGDGARRLRPVEDGSGAVTARAFGRAGAAGRYGAAVRPWYRIAISLVVES